jgi:hypothetical protein
MEYWGAGLCLHQLGSTSRVTRGGCGHMRTLIALALSLAAAVAAPTANAVVCYTLLDRNDKLLYRAPLPPVDMSDRGVAQRERLRSQNEYLMVSEVEDCQAVAAVEGTAGYRPATVAEIIREMRGYLAYGGISSMPGITGTVSVGVGGGGGGGGGAAAAPAAAPASSGGMRRY